MRMEHHATLAVATLALTACASIADQLAWNTQEVSAKGARAIKPNSLLVSYCSLCDDQHVEVWRVKKAVVAATEGNGFHEVRVFGKKLSRSVGAFDAGEYAEPVQYQAFPPEEQEGWFLQGIDLAYVYVPTGDTSFRCLGKVLGLECDVQVESISLPVETLAGAGGHKGAKRRTAGALAPPTSDVKGPASP